MCFDLASKVAEIISLSLFFPLLFSTFLTYPFVFCAWGCFILCCCVQFEIFALHVLSQTLVQCTSLHVGHILCSLLLKHLMMYLLCNLALETQLVFPFLSISWCSAPLVPTHLPYFPLSFFYVFPPHR